jgi:hypothetical protein
VDEPTTIDSLIAAVARTPPASDADVRPLALAPGHVLGTSYVIEGELGRGGMGVVYRATDRALGREVAIKVLRADRWPGIPADEVRAIFEREARATARLKHPSIVTAYHAGQDESGLMFLVLEFLRGESLHARLERGALSLETARMIIEETADAVAHAHDRGILHRDLKPQNVFLCDDHRVCLLDFGLAALRHAGGADTSRSRSGTPSAMAPEQWRGEVQDERTDVWAMGLLLYRMITGGAGPMATCETDLRTWLEALEVDDVPPAIAAVIRAALAVDPAMRPASARAFHAALRRAWPRPTTALAAAAVAARRRPARWIAGAAVVAAAAVGGAAWQARAHDDPPAARLTIAQKVGVYASDAYGEVVFVMVGDQLRGAYRHDDGLIVGTLRGDELVGMWCELPSRRIPTDAGSVRFRFMRDPEGRVLADGRWRYGRDGGWDELWDMYRVADAPGDPALTARASDPSLTCPDLR